MTYNRLPHLLILVVIFMLPRGSLAQIPRTISYQGVLTDAAGNLVPDGNQQLDLSLYSSAAGGSAIYTETQTVPVVKGIFNNIDRDGRYGNSRSAEF